MSAKRRIRVLVVDDSAFVRKAVVRMLGEGADIEVVGTAADGEEGLARARELRPDVVTLDKSSVEPMSMLSLTRELLEKVRALGVARVKARPEGKACPAPALREEGAEVVVIAASTGGPSSLQSLVPALPASLRATIFIVQHIPKGFTRSLAERLDARSAIPVREAADGDRVEPARVIIAPAGIHTRLERRGARVRIVLDEEPRDALHRPSADVLMASAAAAYGARTVGVVLTGMGSDGTEGLRAIRAAGGTTLAESEDTCVIYGMPKAAVAAGVVSRVVPLNRMAEEILAEV
jgi:two-component system chemotaxis response regulator CheB